MNGMIIDSLLILLRDICYVATNNSIIVKISSISQRHPVVLECIHDVIVRRFQTVLTLVQ